MEANFVFFACSDLLDLCQVVFCFCIMYFKVHLNIKTIAFTVSS